MICSEYEMDMNMTMNMTMEMQSTFYSDHHFEFLFDNIHVDSTEKYSGALVALFLLAALLGVLNYFVGHFTSLYKDSAAFNNGMRRLIVLLMMGLLKFLSISLSSILMLAVMTYNTGVFLVICIGLAVTSAIIPHGKETNEELLSKLAPKQDNYLRSANS